MKWRKFIEEYGPAGIANKLLVHHNTVRHWVKEGGVPKDKYKIMLVKLAKGKIKYEDFFK